MRHGNNIYKLKTQLFYYIFIKEIIRKYHDEGEERECILERLSVSCACNSG